MLLFTAVADYRLKRYDGDNDFEGSTNELQKPQRE